MILYSIKLISIYRYLFIITNYPDKSLLVFPLIYGPITAMLIEEKDLSDNRRLMFEVITIIYIY